jgi:hypothetical protein
LLQHHWHCKLNVSLADHVNDVPYVAIPGGQCLETRRNRGVDGEHRCCGQAKRAGLGYRGRVSRSGEPYWGAHSGMCATVMVAACVSDANATPAQHACLHPSTLQPLLSTKPSVVFVGLTCSKLVAPHGGRSSGITQPLPLLRACAAAPGQMRRTRRCWRRVRGKSTWAREPPPSGRLPVHSTNFWPHVARCVFICCHNHHSVAAGVHSTADGHACTTARKHVPGGHISRMCNWRLSSDCTELADGDASLRVM